MDYAAWTNKRLARLELMHDAHVTSVWCTEPNGKPLLVLVHGISGDHIGMVPLAHELAKHYRVAIIEMPGHGKSDSIPLPNAQALQRWFDSAMVALEEKMGTVAAVCAHSFGCSAVLSGQTVERRKIILLNPVPTPSGMYVTYSRMIMNSAHLWAHVYNFRLFVMLRSLTLTKLRTREAKRRVRWVGWRSKPSFEQIVFQAGLVDMILDGSAYRHAGNGGVSLVVCGLYDTTARQRDSLDMEGVFGGAHVVFLRGGHLLPIESPDRVARLIRDTVIK